jgi:hypothetical protein
LHAVALAHTKLPAQLWGEPRRHAPLPSHVETVSSFSPHERPHTVTALGYEHTVVIPSHVPPHVASPLAQRGL